MLIMCGKSGIWTWDQKRNQLKGQQSMSPQFRTYSQTKVKILASTVQPQDMAEAKINQDLHHTIVTGNEKRHTEPLKDKTYRDVQAHLNKRNKISFRHIINVAMDWNLIIWLTSFYIKWYQTCTIRYISNIQIQCK